MKASRLYELEELEAHEELGDELRVQMHEGTVLLRLARNYPALFPVLLETTQNAVDSRAKRIDIEIDLSSRKYRVFDDGIGATRKQVAKALRSVGRSLKTDQDQYGQYGIGLVAPLAVADKFTFVSIDKEQFFSYLFVTKVIINQERVSVPVSRMTPNQLPGRDIWWRTRVEATGLSRDKRTTALDPDELAEGIALRFGKAIRERNIKITIRFTAVDGSKKEVAVTAPEFTGRPLEVFEVGEVEECGKVSMSLFIANLHRGTRKGKVLFGNTTNPSRILAPDLVACAKGMLKPEVQRALTSGVLEGTVLCEKVVMHENRVSFVDNDALAGLCMVLDAWYEGGGKDHVEAAEDEASDTHFQRIGMSVMPFADVLVRQRFAAVFERISVGMTGRSPDSVPKKELAGVDSAKSVAAVPPANGEAHSNPGGGKEAEELAKHRPGVVTGPRGRRRTRVKSQSTGLTFDYAQLKNWRIPFEYDPATGTLTLNLLNPGWGLCSDKDKHLRAWHIAVLLAALSLESSRAADGSLDPKLEQFAREHLEQQAFAILHGDAMTVK